MRKGGSDYFYCRKRSSQKLVKLFIRLLESSSTVQGLESILALATKKTCTIVTKGKGFKSLILSFNHKKRAHLVDASFIELNGVWFYWFNSILTGNNRKQVLGRPFRILCHYFLLDFNLLYLLANAFE